MLDGEEGEIEPGLRWIRTPGHSDGLISLLVDTDDGLVVIASDCVGPLPEYFEQMDLPDDFGPERDELLTQWRTDQGAGPGGRDPGPQPAGQAALRLSTKSLACRDARACRVRYAPKAGGNVAEGEAAAGVFRREMPVESKTVEAGFDDPRRELSGEKVQRIVDAMRHCVAERGIAGATFEHVSREAGVSRGLLHYYFGTKERLLIEVLRNDAETRIAMLDEPLAAANTVDDVIAVLVAGAEEMLREDPGFYVILYELFTAGRQNPDIQAELAELYQRSRDHVAGALRQEGGRGRAVAALRRRVRGHLHVRRRRRRRAPAPHRSRA